MSYPDKLATDTVLVQFDTEIDKVKLKEDNNASMNIQSLGSSNCTISLKKMDNVQFALDLWMEKHIAELEDRKLCQIALPGSHDAGIYITLLHRYL